VAKTDDFLNITYTNLCKFLDQDEINISELDFFNAVLRYELRIWTIMLMNSSVKFYLLIFVFIWFLAGLSTSASARTWKILLRTCVWFFMLLWHWSASHWWLPRSLHSKSCQSSFWHPSKLLLSFSICLWNWKNGEFCFVNILHNF